MTSQFCLNQRKPPIKVNAVKIPGLHFSSRFNLEITRKLCSIFDHLPMYHISPLQSAGEDKNIAIYAKIIILVYNNNSLTFGDGNKIKDTTISFAIN